MPTMFARNYIASVCVGEAHGGCGAHKDLPAGGYDMASEPSQRVSRFPKAPP